MNFRLYFLLLTSSVFAVYSVSAEKSTEDADFDPFKLYSTKEFFNLDGLSNGTQNVNNPNGTAPCTEEDLEQFPLRMRTWLFNVMQQLSSYPHSEGGLSEGERDLLYQAQEMENSNYIIPVHWKFLKLDENKNGDLETETELKKFVGMLNPIESCIDKFLFEVCDENSNKKISKAEWSGCLRLSSEESSLSVEF